MMATLIAAACVAVWTYLIAGRGVFWLARERDSWRGAAPPVWPPVAAVVPARNEAESIARCVRALLAQDYPGPLQLVVVDDNSADGTADIVHGLAASAPRPIDVIAGAALPAGWTGKLWAMKQGVEVAQASVGATGYLLLMDADIECAPDMLTQLVAQAERRGLVLTSLMAKLRCESLAERLTVPAFIFFFQMLYPFAWVNRPDRATAAAAGGCMLVQAEALRRAGGIAAIRGALIDDCALARIMKRQGPIWLALTDRVRSLRPYPRLDDIRRMVARSAYAQLNYSLLLLAGTVAAMTLTYLAPPLLALFATGAAGLLGAVAWLAMTVALQPTLRFYRLSPLWGVALPVTALLYLLFTVDSALQHARGRGGLWKGRVQSSPSLP